MPTGFYCNGCAHTNKLSKQVKSVSKKYTCMKAVCAVLLTLLCFSLAANLAFICTY
jgi:hypothetical protein